MSRFIISFFLALAPLALFAQEQYKNPIISADYSDPDVIRVGEDYYMVSSSFNIVPGLPVLHSKDLIHWTIISHGVQRLPQALFSYRNRKADALDYSLPRLGKGVFAPCIRHHDGYFWIFWADPDAGAYMVKAKNPEGPWSEPHLIKKAHGWIDTSPLWDETTGRAWLAHAYAHSRCGINGKVAVAEMSWDAKELLTEDSVVFDANDRDTYPADRKHSVIEGCKFMQRNAYYYIMCPAGGVPTGWQTAMRAKHPQGPYEIKVVCERGNTNVNGPHQGGLVDTPEGEWWFAHFQSVNVLGRIVWLQPAKWENGWPIIGCDSNGDGTGNPVISYQKPSIDFPGQDYEIQTSDDFSNDVIGLQWQWPANTGASYCSVKNGKLEIKPYVSTTMTLIDAPNVITQMFPAFSFSAVAKVKLIENKDNIRGGLAVMGRKCFDIGIENADAKQMLSVRFGNESVDSVSIPQSEVYLKLIAQGEHPLPLEFKGEVNRGTVKCQFYYSLDGEVYSPIADSFQAKAGVWIGARLGLYCLVPTATDGFLEVDMMDVSF